ncbi:MAG: MFS transporter, partial [Candidatus Bathyarchaeota archaeon]
MLRKIKEDSMVFFRYPQLFPLCFAVFVSMLGFGLVMPILPIYARDFGATGSQLGLLTASFAIARLITTFPGGWLADRAGRKKPIILGLLAYSVVMALYGLSQDTNQLIILRGLQGLASGIVWPIISTMVVEMVLPVDRSKSMGLYEMMHFLGLVVGPSLGGVLAEVFNIAIPFFVCGTLALLSSLLVAFTVQETHTEKSREAAQFRTSDPQIDRKGITKAVKELTPFVGVFIGLCLARFILAFSNSLMQPVLSVYAHEEIGISEAGIGILFTVQAIATLLVTIP